MTDPPSQPAAPAASKEQRSAASTPAGDAKPARPNVFGEWRGGLDDKLCRQRGFRPGCRWEVVVFGLLALAPWTLGGAFNGIGGPLTSVLILCIAALGLNVVVGFTGLLHLGMAAFMGIGGLLLAILTVPTNPLEIGFLPAVCIGVVGSAAAGCLLAAVTLRLRADSLAVVTLGFGEVVRVLLGNLEQIAGGMQGLGPVPPPGAGLTIVGTDLGRAFVIDPRWFYYLALATLTAVIAVLRWLERSAVGRAWIAFREDSLAAETIGVSGIRVRLSAFAIGAAIVGLAGCLSVANLGTTGDPRSYGFGRSVAILCAVMLGGLGSLRGTLLGVAILFGLDIVVIPAVDAWSQQFMPTVSAAGPLTLGSWRLALVGLALIIMMRFRPEGLLPSRRLVAELREARR